MDDVCGISTAYSGLILITVWLVYCLWNVVYHNYTKRPLPPCTVVFPNRRFSPTGWNLGAVDTLEQRKPCRAKGSSQGPVDGPLFRLVAATNHWSIGRVATNNWWTASVLREGTLGVKAPRPCGPMPARARRPRAGEDSYCQVVEYGILYTTVPVRRAMLSRHGYAAKPLRSNV